MSLQGDSSHKGTKTENEPDRSNTVDDREVLEITIGRGRPCVVGVRLPSPAWKIGASKFQRYKTVRGSPTGRRETDVSFRMRKSWVPGIGEERAKALWSTQMRENEG